MTTSNSDDETLKNNKEDMTVEELAEITGGSKPTGIADHPYCTANGTVRIGTGTDAPGWKYDSGSGMCVRYY